jgi:hypothetical protein
MNEKVGLTVRSALEAQCWVSELRHCLNKVNDGIVADLRRHGDRGVSARHLTAIVACAPSLINDKQTYPDDRS